MHGWESQLPGEKLPTVAVEAVAASLKVAGGQLDSAADRRSTMLERHSKLEAPAGPSPNVSARKVHKVMIQKVDADMFIVHFRVLSVFDWKAFFHFHY